MRNSSCRCLRRCKEWIKLGGENLFPSAERSPTNVLYFQRCSKEVQNVSGSGGAGKSHFMAMLYLLLNGNTQARSVPELADVVQRMGTWAEGRRFLLVPYYLMDALSVEQCILG